MLLIIVHRLLQNFISPPLNSIIILIMGIGIVRFFRKTGAAIIIFGILSLYLQSIPLTSYLLTKSIEPPALIESQIKSISTIVVLGGGLNYEGYEYESRITVNTSTLVRLKYTAYLAKKYPNNLIVTSGGYTGRIREADVMKRTLIDTFGIKNKIIVEDNSRNTDENAEFVAKMLLAKNIHNIILVTQAYHMRRALMLFKKYGLNPIAASTDYYHNDDAITPTLSIIPTAKGMLQMSIVYHELVGYLFYK